MSLVAANLSVRRGQQMVLRGVSLSVHPGQLAVLTGANGCGKTTLLRVLAGLLPPDDGSVAWYGQPMKNGDGEKDWQLIGHQDAVKPDLTVREMLDYWQALAAQTQALQDDPFGVMAWRDVAVRRLSAGQRRRLSLSRLFLRSVRLWLLDEPTAALDAAAQEILANRIAQHRQTGGMVVVATHQALPWPQNSHLDLSEVAA